jgi:hypothetical protein
MTFKVVKYSFCSESLHRVVTKLREFERNGFANSLVDQCFDQNNSEEDITAPGRVRDGCYTFIRGERSVSAAETILT